MRVTSQANGTATSVGRDDDARGQQHRVPDELPGRRLAEDLERPPAARDPDDQVRERQEEKRDDDARREDERERGTRPRSSTHVR